MCDYLPNSGSVRANRVTEMSFISGIDLLDPELHIVGGLRECYGGGILMVSLSESGDGKVDCPPFRILSCPLIGWWVGLALVGVTEVLPERPPHPDRRRAKERRGPLGGKGLEVLRLDEAPRGPAPGWPRKTAIGRPGTDRRAGPGTDVK